MSGRLKKSKHRLVLQITIVVVPFFIIMFAAVVYSMYSGALRGYIKAQNENIETSLTMTTLPLLLQMFPARVFRRHCL